MRRVTQPVTLLRPGTQLAAPICWTTWIRWAICIGAVLALSTTVQAGSIGGTVYEDLDRSGERGADENGVPGAPITLLGDDGAVLSTTRTAADGTFLFEGLPDGDYLLSLPELAQVRVSMPNDVAVDAPIPNFPFGSPRYTLPAHLVDNLLLADQLGETPSHIGLGDSIGFGFNFCGSLLGENGYFEPTTDRLRRAAPGGFRGDKQAVPGDETDDLLDPDVDLFLFNNDVFYTVDEQPELVSISIGGNDFLGAVSGGDAELADALVTARRNIQEIVSSLVGELPNADVEFNTVYDNLEGDDPLHNTWAPIWMQVVREHAWAQAERVTIAEVYPEYAHDESGEQKGEPDLICSFFGLDDIHPINDGYDVHEEKLWQSFGGVTLSGGSDQLNLFLGVLRQRAETAAGLSEEISGDVTDAELALVADGRGALVGSDGGELRVSDFLPLPAPTNFELVQAVLSVTYRTTGAPIDDYYRFEASVDGTFAEPGQTPTSWNTILPLVGSSGNGSAERLGFPDQPEFRTVSAPVFLGAPTDNGTSTLSFEDLEGLSVRLLTTAVGDPDPYSVEWDSASIAVYARPVSSDSAPAARTATARPGEELSVDALRLLARTDHAAARQAVLDALQRQPRRQLVGLLGELGQLRDLPRLEAWAADSDSPLRAAALLAMSRIDRSAAAPVLRRAISDANAIVRRVAARELRQLDDGLSRQSWLRLLTDGDARTRAEAFEALASVALARAADGVGDVSVAPFELDLAMAEFDRRTRTVAGRSLLHRGHPLGTELLIELAASWPPVDEAQRLLGSSASSFEVLRQALALGSPDERAVAATAIADRGEASRVRELLASLRSSSHRRLAWASHRALATVADRRALSGIDRRADWQRLSLWSGFSDRLALAARYEMAADPAISTSLRVRAVRSLAVDTADPERLELIREYLEQLARDATPRVARLAQSVLTQQTPNLP